MSDVSEPPSAAAASQTPVATLTRAWPLKGKVCFEVRMDKADPAKTADFAEQLLVAFFAKVHDTQDCPYEPYGPITSLPDERDPSKIKVIYKPHWTRKSNVDEPRFLDAFRAEGVAIGEGVAESAAEAFKKLAEVQAQERSEYFDRLRASDAAREARRNDPSKGRTR